MCHELCFSNLADGDKHYSQRFVNSWKFPPNLSGQFFPQPKNSFVFFFFFNCSGFCHTLKWNSHGFTCVPHPDPPSHLPLHPIPLGLPSFSYTCTRRYSAPDSKLSRPPRPSPLQLLPSRTLPCKFCLYLYSLPTPYPQFTGSTGPLWVPLSYTAIWKLIQSSNLEQF